ncbi:MAG: RuBisCO large subunit C-terminal-like domain-containing protein [Elusimicrobiota bacterium]|jgi:ribulose-bisphosphate carboxylase large chain
MISGKRFKVHYRLAGLLDETAARAVASDIALEQTVELPDDLIPSQTIRHSVVGQIESLERQDDHTFETVISYAEETTGNQIPQFLNVLFGNCSIKPNIRVQRLELPEGLFDCFRGPRFGVEGLRQRLGVPERPLLCTALKPMGLNAKELADLAYRFALGGIDLIKDDHGLADQPFARFDERVERCAAAVAQANRETGGHSLYFPNVSLSSSDFPRHLRFAQSAGAGGFLISPGLTGFDAMRRIAENDEWDLPILMHPAFLGSFVTHPDNGLSHFALFGQLARLAGADGSIFPSFGGRFSFSQAECAEIAEGCAAPMGHFKRIFPVPGGGMSLERVPEMLSVYGRDVIFLIGGALFRHGPDLTANARHFRERVERSLPAETTRT